MTPWVPLLRQDKVDHAEQQAFGTNDVEPRGDSLRCSLPLSCQPRFLKQSPCLDTAYGHSEQTTGQQIIENR